MRHGFALIWTAGLVSILNVAVASAAELSLFQPNDLKSDLALVRSALEEAHPDLYRYTEKAELDRAWDRAAAGLDHPMTALEFYNHVAPVLALVKDGHLGWSHSAEVTAYLDEIPVLPLGVRLLGRRPMVFRDLSNSGPSLAGFEIVSVNGTPAAKLVEEMWSRQMGDGDVVSSRGNGVGAGFVRQLVSVCNLRPPYEVVFHRSQADRSETRRFDGRLPADLTSFWRMLWPNDPEMRKERPPAELEFLDDGRIARMRVPSFGGSAADAKRRDLRGFFADAFVQIKTKQTQALIIDVRDNGGGEDEAGQILASYLIDKPFRYYRDLTVRGTSFKFADYISSPDPIPAEMISKGEDDRLHLTGHPNLGMKTPREPGFSGKLFLLINGGSFSTTGEFLSIIRSKRPATFIGAEAGAGFSGNNSGFEPAITLPATKLILRIPLVGYYLDVSTNYPSRRGVLPDNAVRYSIDEMIAGTDKELELALSLARKAGARD
ncbi:MAG TPA: S41 family peptidase [Chthoniobacterales bacterium]|nr:S41 family peptidase [Chthoniobacterales bacterium]